MWYVVFSNNERKKNIKYLSYYSREQFLCTKSTNIFKPHDKEMKQQKTVM